MTYKALAYICRVLVMTEKLVGIKEIKVWYIIPIGCLFSSSCHHFPVWDEIRRAIPRLVSQLVEVIILGATMISRTPSTISCRAGWWRARDRERRRKNMILSSFWHDLAKEVGKLKARNFSKIVIYGVCLRYYRTNLVWAWQLLVQHHVRPDVNRKPQATSSPFLSWSAPHIPYYNLAGSANLASIPDLRVRRFAETTMSVNESMITNNIPYWKFSVYYNYAVSKRLSEMESPRTCWPRRQVLTNWCAISPASWNQRRRSSDSLIRSRRFLTSCKTWEFALRLPNSQWFCNNNSLKRYSQSSSPSCHHLNCMSLDTSASKKYSQVSLRKWSAEIPLWAEGFWSIHTAVRWRINTCRNIDPNIETNLSMHNYTDVAIGPHQQLLQRIAVFREIKRNADEEALISFLLELERWVQKRNSLRNVRFSQVETSLMSVGIERGCSRNLRALLMAPSGEKMAGRQYANDILCPTLAQSSCRQMMATLGINFE